MTAGNKAIPHNYNGAVLLIECLDCGVGVPYPCLQNDSRKDFGRPCNIRFVTLRGQLCGYWTREQLNLMYYNDLLTRKEFENAWGVGESKKNKAHYVPPEIEVARGYMDATFGSRRPRGR